VRGGSKPISIGRWVFRFHFHGGVSIRLVCAAVGLVGGIKAYSCSLLCLGKRRLVAGFCSINHSSFSGTRQHFDELFWSFGPHPYHLVGDGAQQSTCLHAVTQIWKQDVHMSLFYIPLLILWPQIP